MSFTMKKELASTFDEAMAQLPEALKSEGFGVLTQIDVQKTLASKLGVAFRRYTILGACNPTLAYEALSTTLEVGAMLPCNVVVYEMDDGRAVAHAIDPMQTVAAGDSRLAKVAAMVQAKLGRVLDRLR